MPDGGGPVIVHDRGDIGDGGEDPLVAAGEAGHEVRFDEAEHDAAVGLDIVTSHGNREPVAGRADGHERAGVMRVVVHHPVARQHLRADHGAQLVRGVDPVRAGAIDDDDLLRRHVRELGEDPGQQAIGRQRPRDVRDDDRHSLVRSDALPQWLAADGSAYRRREGRRLIRQPGNKGRLDDPHPCRRDLDVKAIMSVLQVNLHGRPLLGRGTLSMVHTSCQSAGGPPGRVAGWERLRRSRIDDVEVDLVHPIRLRTVLH